LVPTGVAGVLFDWDGVLLDSLGAALNVYNKIFAEVGAKQLTLDEYLQMQSPNWYDFYERVGLPVALWKRVDAEWLRLYQEERPRLFPDALGCLGLLGSAGVKMALVSNGSRDRVEEELARFDLRGRFEAVLLAEKKEELKPSPVLLERALSAMRVEPQNAAYLGDSPADMQAAKNARVPSFGIARGPIQRERLGYEKPDHVFGGLDDAAGFIVGHPAPVTGRTPGSEKSRRLG